MTAQAQTALAAPLIVLNSFGFSGAETLATFMASHASIGLLPGQNFIQQNHTLYRPIIFPENNAAACFDLLATKQYTKAGIQWAGLGKFMSPEYAARYSLDAHRSRFIDYYARLNDSDKASYTSLVKLYTHCFFESIGENTAALSHYGFYGSNLLLNASAYPNFNSDTSVLQVKPSCAEWLALASQARTWNPEEAISFYIIQNLFISLCERSQNNIHSIRFHDLIKDTENTVNSCCKFLDLPKWNPERVVNGQGHAPATQEFFDKIFNDADNIKTIYANSQWFEFASSISDWENLFLDDEKAVALLQKYRSYWNTSSHIAFDWSGPLENQLKELIYTHAKRVSKQAAAHSPGIAYQFYQQWYKLNSSDHTQVIGLPMYPLGELEAEIPVPQLQYFLRIAINYIQTSVKLQGEKLHSYHCVRKGYLYQTLCSEEIQAVLDRNFLRDAFNEMQSTIEHTESLFLELRDSGVANAEKIANPEAQLNTKISPEEIQSIAVSGPDITEHEHKLVTAAMNDWYKNPYYFCEAFEQRFAAYHHRKFALMTPNCTSANHLLLMGLDIGSGDEVLVPEATWIASAAPIYYTGATPVYCDIDADDWCISIDSIKKNLTANTRAIIVVNLYGNMGKMNELEQFAKEHDLYLIEDAAESVGSVYKGRKSGEFGVGSLFSFHRTKTITTGEGGMLLIDDEALYKRCVKLRDHGRGPETPAFTHEMVTNKYMPFNIQAALGLGQFDRLDQLVDKKRHILHFYKKRLARFNNLQLNPDTDDLYNSAWCSTIILGDHFSYDKTTLMAALKNENIPSRPFFFPLSTQPGIQEKLGGNVDFSLKNPVAFALSGRGINLPSALNLTDIQLDHVCTVLENLLDADMGKTQSEMSA